MLRSNSFQKEMMVVAGMRALHSKCIKLMGVPYWLTAREIAEQIGYKSPVSVREVLKELEYDNLVITIDGNEGIGCCAPMRLYMLRDVFYASKHAQGDNREYWA